MDFPIKNLTTLLLLFIGTTVFINGIIFYFRLYKKTYSNKPIPGYIIGTIWTILIGCMAYAQYLVLQKIEKIEKIDNKNKYIQWLIPFLFIYCILYPFYTLGFTNKSVINFTNILTIILSAFIVYSIYDITKMGAFFISLTTIWAIYVTVM